MYKELLFILAAMFIQVRHVDAAQPKAVVVGPKESLSGDIVILDASQSSGTTFKWRLCLEPGQADKMFFGKSTDPQICFSAGVLKDTTYRFALAAAAPNSNGGIDIDITFHDLLIKPLYPPNVPIPVPDLPVVNPPIGPVTSPVARALILHENDQDTQSFQKLVQAIRNNKELSKLVPVLDKNAKDFDDQPNPKVQSVLKAIGDVPLPRVVALSSEWAVIKNVEVPKTEEDLTKLLKEWGLVK